MRANEKKKQALAARIAAGSSLKDAAEAERVPIRTAARWASEPGFDVEVAIVERARARRTTRKETPGPGHIADDVAAALGGSYDAPG
jgi:hypothetical protein